MINNTEIALEVGSQQPESGASELEVIDVRTGKQSRLYRALARLAISALLLGWLAAGTDWARMRQTFATLRVELWLAAVAVYLLAQVVSGFRWKLLAEPLGFSGSWMRYTSFYFVGMYFNMLLPTAVGGDVVKAYYLNSGSGHWLRALLSVLIDRVSGLLVLLLVACVGLACCPIALPWWILAGVWGTAVSGLASLAILPLLARWTAPGGRIHRLSEASLIYFRYPGVIAGTTLLSVVVQAGNVILAWLVGQAMNAPVPGFYYWIMVPMVTVATLLPVSINGMGVREYTTALFLLPLGVNSDLAHCLAFLWFLALTAGSLVGGAVYLFGSYPRPEAQSKDESFRSDPDQG